VSSIILLFIVLVASCLFRYIRADVVASSPSIESKDMHRVCFTKLYCNPVRSPVDSPDRSPGRGPGRSPGRSPGHSP
jgi:hypothetical protein